MVSARLFAQISSRICQAQSWDPLSKDNPFGGISMIFSGNLGQLKPVHAKSLFSYDLVSRLSLSVAQSPKGQTALYRAFLWRQLTNVVELKKNWCSKNDPEFINLLQRVHQGMAWNGSDQMTVEQKGDGKNYKQSDYKTLQGRCLQSIAKTDSKAISGFDDALIIVAQKTVRDMLNNHVTKKFTQKTKQKLYYYHSLDCYR